MDTIRYLLKFLVVLVIALFIVASGLYLLGRAFPNLTPQSVYAFMRDNFSRGLQFPSSSSKYVALVTMTDPPVNMGGKVYGKEYESSAEFNGYGSGAYNPNIAYVMYTATGTEIIQPGRPRPVQAPVPSSTNVNSQPRYASYIRNLSLYKGGTISARTTFVGEARKEMFYNGVFPVFIIDSSGHLVTTLTARAMNVWSAPGWQRFQVVVQTTLPNNTQCVVLFQSAHEQMVRIGLPVVCSQ